MLAMTSALCIILAAAATAAVALQDRPSRFLEHVAIVAALAALALITLQVIAVFTWLANY
jgi:hypothetical protein